MDMVWSADKKEIVSEEKSGIYIHIFLDTRFEDRILIFVGYEEWRKWLYDLLSDKSRGTIITNK